MARVVPSQVRQVIEAMFPAAVWQARGDTREGVLYRVDSRLGLAALLNLVDQLSSDFLVVGAAEAAAYHLSIGAIREVLRGWGSNTNLVLQAPEGITPRMSPVAHIWRVLQQCPDAFPSPTTVQLPFISDSQLRDALRLDIDAASRSLANGGWKAATVLAGSVIEALLLWATTRHPQADWERAMQQAVAAKLIKGRKDDPENWHLPDYIEVAAELDCITIGTRDEARRTKEYRNLIHPGRAQRTGQQCDLGTAHVAVGTLDHVIRDIAAKGAAHSCP